MLHLDQLETLRDLIAAIACAGLVVASLEWLMPAAKLAPSSLVYANNAAYSPRQQGQIAWVTRGAMILRLAAATLVVTSALLSLPTGFYAVGVLAAALAILPLRLAGPWGPFAGMNGAEHLLGATILVLAPTYLLGTRLAIEVAIGFVAFRALSEYASAGLTKLGDLRGWISGRNLVLVYSSGAYGFRHLARLLRRIPAVAGGISLAVIVVEVAVPVSLLLPSPWTEHALALAFLFHLATGFFMGLNTFSFAFAATYPAILWLRDLIQLWQV